MFASVHEHKGMAYPHVQDWIGAASPEPQDGIGLTGFPVSPSYKNTGLTRWLSSDRVAYKLNLYRHFDG